METKTDIPTTKLVAVYEAVVHSTVTAKRRESGILSREKSFICLKPYTMRKDLSLMPRIGLVNC